MMIRTTVITDLEQLSILFNNYRVDGKTINNCAIGENVKLTQVGVVFHFRK